jgi:hypothetical protein
MHFSRLASCAQLFQMTVAELTFRVSLVADSLSVRNCFGTGGVVAAEVVCSLELDSEAVAVMGLVKFPGWTLGCLRFASYIVDQMCVNQQ